MADYERLARDVDDAAARAGQTIVVENVARTSTGQDCETCVFTDGSGFSIDCAIAEGAPGREDAIAHERAHLRLLYGGLVDVYNEYGFLPHEVQVGIANAISHVHVVRLLETEYQISSDVHFAACEVSLERLRRTVVDPSASTVELVLAGVALFDLSRSVPGMGSEAAAIANQNEQVKDAFEAAERHLGSIVPRTTPLAEQRVAVQAFLAEAVRA